MIHYGSGAGSPSINLQGLSFQTTLLSDSDFLFYFVLFKVGYHFQSQLSVHHLDEGDPTVLFYLIPEVALDSFTSKIYNDNRKNKLIQRCEFIKCHLLRVTFFTKHE